VELAIDKVARIVRDVKDIDIDDLYDQLEKLRDNVHQLSHRVGKSASRQYRRTRDYASEAAQEAEELMKDNLAASLVLALGIGLIVGYFIRPEHRLKSYTSLSPAMDGRADSWRLQSK